jgi:penicillin amidase
VAYTVFGPVQYDNSFTGGSRTSEYSNLAVRWKAHDGSNELKTFYLLDRMTGYDDYVQAIKNFTCPGQNFVFAAKNNDIAIWHQGKYPAKWRRQGDFIMPGTDTSYLWQGYIKQEENPNMMNPVRGFVSSANQLPADSTYPYYLGGSYALYRGKIINRYLRQMQDITIDDMKRMQTDNYNIFAEAALPILFANIDTSALSIDEKKYLDTLRKWNRFNDPDERGPAIFQLWFDNLEKEVWNDELEEANRPIVLPEPGTLLKLMRTPHFKFADNINTKQVETVQDVVTAAFKKAVPDIDHADLTGALLWSIYKDSGIRHLLRLAPLSRFHLYTGGGANIINATKQFHGPSWRMIVELKDSTEAWGVYPGGQSGNPGSKYYDNFIGEWAEGKYNRLWVMNERDIHDPRILFTMRFSK